MFSRTEPAAGIAAPPVAVAVPAARSSWRPALWFLVAALGAIAAIQYTNPRILGAWHGFVHSAIANRFDVLSFPPENPFFAGEPLPYYWFYQFAGYCVSLALGLDLLHTFQLFSTLSLGVFIVASAAIGRIYSRSKFAGPAIALLALAGINPLGPVIAAAKHVLRGVPVVEHRTGPIETVFVTDQTADNLMTHPLLPAMYMGADWRHGQNMVWFFDISSRAPALAMLMVLLYLMADSSGGRRRYTALIMASAVLTALSPVIGLSVAAALGVAAVAVVASGERLNFTPVALTAACVAGAILAAPTYYHMFSGLGGGSGMSLFGKGLAPLSVVAANALLIAPLAVAGARRIGAMAVIAPAVLFVVVVAVHLPEGNEHNLANAAYCLLAIPAGVALAAAPRRWAALALLAIVPVTAATLFAFATRPPMPLATSGRLLVRTPAGGDLQRFYEWARRATPRDSVFIADPQSPVKMSGNVSELPAFTGRTLFTDTPNYLTSPNREAALRAQWASQIVRGEAPTAGQRDYLARLRRPIYIVNYKPGNEDGMARLYGPPVFHRGMVSVYAW